MGYERFFFGLISLIGLLVLLVLIGLLALLAPALDAFATCPCLVFVVVVTLDEADRFAFGGVLTVFFGVAAALAVGVFLAGVVVLVRAGLGAARSNDWRSMISKKRFFSTDASCCAVFSSLMRSLARSSSAVLISS